MKSKAWTEKFMQGVFFVAACASVLAVWDWETDIGKGQDRQRQLLSFDAGSTGTGDSKAKGGKDSESCSCSRASPYRVWKGKTEIQGVSVSEGTANPFLI